MVSITPQAAEKLRAMIAEENKGTEVPANSGLRLYVQGGGCSGFQYGLAIEKEPQPADQVFESNGIKIFVDPVSINYLKGVLIYWKDNLVGGGFAIENPNVKGTCGCGSSFEPK